MFCIAHRGASGYEPENTLAAIRKAIELGAVWFEVDVYRKDDRLLVIHDDQLERTTNGRGKIEDHSLADLRKLDAGNGQQIPFLTEVLDVLQHALGTKANINIELKGPRTAAPAVAMVQRFVREHGWHRSQFLLSCFQHQQLREVRELDSEIPIGALMEKGQGNRTQRALQLNAFSMNLPLVDVSAEIVDEAHQAGLKVFVFTVNELADIQRMRSIKVDGVFTDFPDRV